MDPVILFVGPEEWTEERRKRVTRLTLPRINHSSELVYWPLSAQRVMRDRSVIAVVIQSSSENLGFASLIAPQLVTPGATLDVVVLCEYDEAHGHVPSGVTLEIDDYTATDAVANAINYWYYSREGAGREG